MSTGAEITLFGIHMHVYTPSQAHYFHGSIVGMYTTACTQLSVNGKNTDTLRCPPPPPPHMTSVRNRVHLDLPAGRAADTTRLILHRSLDRRPPGVAYARSVNAPIITKSLSPCTHFRRLKNPSLSSEAARATRELV